MQSRAYVLIEAEAGQVSSVLTTLRAIPGVTAADPVTGPYDIIVVLETDEQREIGRIVMNALHGISGIKRTITCLAI
ncbi:MAG TPA: Lrp/AsnC ligand binding domain-containing protein [Roseiflexaceae bacterium]|nr:Lrp/AsnC ligand binding domain-containing protein [Roseiflexaceae bacterium]